MAKSLFLVCLHTDAHLAERQSFLRMDYQSIARSVYMSFLRASDLYFHGAPFPLFHRDHATLSAFDLVRIFGGIRRYTFSLTPSKAHQSYTSRRSLVLLHSELRLAQRCIVS